MRCVNCGAEAIACLTPSGRVVDIEPEHVWLKASEPWPTGLFRLGASGGGHGPACPVATPVLEAVDRVVYWRRTGFAGPFRKEHRCALA